MTILVALNFSLQFFAKLFLTKKLLGKTLTPQT